MARNGIPHAALGLIDPGFDLGGYQVESARGFGHRAHSQQDPLLLHRYALSDPAFDFNPPRHEHQPDAVSGAPSAWRQAVRTQGIKTKRNCMPLTEMVTMDTCAHQKPHTIKMNTQLKE